MKDYEIAARYKLNLFEFRKHLEKNADFPIKKTFGGEIIIPDHVNIENFVRPLLSQEFLAAEEKRLKERNAKYRSRIAQLKDNGFDGYYEYKVISLSDVGGLFNSNSGKVDINAMTMTLNELGVEGWHLVTAYSNEMGKNALSGGAGGAILGVNSTVDENILIFERFVKI